MSAFCGFHDVGVEGACGFPPTRFEARTAFQSLVSGHQPAFLMRCCASCKAAKRHRTLVQCGTLMNGCCRSDAATWYELTKSRPGMFRNHQPGRRAWQCADTGDEQIVKRETANTRMRSQGRLLGRTTFLIQPSVSTTNHRQCQQRQKVMATVPMQRFEELIAAKKWSLRGSNSRPWRIKDFLLAPRSNQLS
jgi:hypothetical protein